MIYVGIFFRLIYCNNSRAYWCIFLGEHVHNGSGLTCIFIALVLGVLEVSLSFDNAVVNAMKLEKMSHKWRHRFLTWGIVIAVFDEIFIPDSGRVYFCQA